VRSGGDTPLYLRRLIGSTLSARGTDLIDEMNQVGVGWWIFEVVTALRLLVASTTDAAETWDASRALCMNVLVLGVPAHPGDDDVVFVPKDEMHTPISVEAPLAYPVVPTRVGSHADSARLASAMPQLLNHTVKPFLHLPAESFDPQLTAASYGDLEP
jgi:hypothetical protein